MNPAQAPAVPRFVDDQGADFQKVVREFLLSFSQLLSVSRFHSMDNEAIRAPLASISEWTRAYCEGGRKIEILFDKGQVFVNSTRLRFTGGSFAMIQAFAGSLDSRKLAGIEIWAPLTPETLRSFLERFNGVSRGTENPASHIEKALAAAGIKEIAVLRPASGAGTGFEVTGDIEMATLLYAKAVVLLRETIRRWEDSSARSYLGTRTTRTIQGIISLAERNPRPFLWLIHVKDSEEYLFNHGANVALLSILLGCRLGIDRNRLCALGAAALFHDLGAFWLPPAAIARKDSFQEEDREALRRHPVHGANLLLGLRRLDEAALARLAVVFEHNIATSGYPRREWPGGLHLFSRIVAVAETYDAMTTRRPFRPARTPDEALRELTGKAGRRFDPEIVRVFTSVLGIYPLGTLVRLDSGELAIVFHVDPSTPRQPLVKIVAAADGSPRTDGELVDIGDNGESGKPRRSIAATVDPEAAGINVHAFLWESHLT